MSGRLILLCGLAGAGKTTLAKQLEAGRPAIARANRSVSLGAGVGGQAMSETRCMSRGVRLRPVVESELADLVRLLWDPLAPGAFQWFGFRMKTAREIERRWHEDGLIGDESSFLTVDLKDGVCAGWVTWRPVGHSGNYEIGIALFPNHRGHGVGTDAQRQLVDYLFSTTTANRLQAGTEVDNIAEQRALERVGFRREGVQRGLYFRAGQWRDSVMYGLLRDER